MKKSTYKKKIARLKDSIINYRYRLVRAAQADGIARTAITFKASRATIRKWKRRFELLGKSGLVEKSRAAITNGAELPLFIQHALCSSVATLMQPPKALQRPFDAEVQVAIALKSVRIFQLLESELAHLIE
jgi:hypothetical protein